MVESAKLSIGRGMPEWLGSSKEACVGRMATHLMNPTCKHCTRDAKFRLQWGDIFSYSCTRHLGLIVRSVMKQSASYHLRPEGLPVAPSRPSGNRAVIEVSLCND
jgi:hypothetical protein